MYLQTHFQALAAALAVALALVSNTVASNSLVARDEPVRNTTGLTDAVTWDNYTLWIQDQRVFLQFVPFTF